VSRPLSQQVKLQARDAYVKARELQALIVDSEKIVKAAQERLTAQRVDQAGYLDVVEALVDDAIDIAHVLACREANPDADVAAYKSADDVAPYQPPGAPLPEDIINKRPWGYWRGWLQEPHLRGNNI
jgi:hypothetical protein